MENITLGQIGSAILYLAAIAGGIGTLYGLLMKGIKAQIQPMQDNMNKQIDSIMKRLEKDEFERLKSDLVTFLCLSEQGIITNEQKLLAHEEFDKYIKPPFNGNSYIKEKFEALHKEGKI